MDTPIDPLAPLDPLVAAVIHDAKNALLALDTQLADIERRTARFLDDECRTARSVDPECRPARADFSAARATATRIAGQLTELLTCFRAQQGRLRLAIDDHDLSDFIDDLLAELGPPPAGIAFAVDRAAVDRLGAWAFDAYLVKLALLDTLRNAFRHARTGVRLGVDTPPEGGVRFSVADDGPGFPEAVLIGAVVQSGGEGTGLGLVFARLIAERHATPAGRHGRVELANHGGATLRLTLP